MTPAIAQFPANQTPQAVVDVVHCALRAWEGVLAVFEFVRLSLAKPSQTQLFGPDGGPPQEISRRAYLDRAFESQRIDFTYYGSNYSFLKDGIFNNTLVGRIGKQVLEPIHSGPDSGFAIEMAEEWKPAWMLLDLSIDSQLIAIQTGIANTKNLIRALFDRIETSTPSLEYESFLEYVSDEGEFWKAVSDYRGKLTLLEFTFVPPNALGLHEKIKSIVEAAKGVGSEKTKFAHTNHAGGLNPNGEYIEAALEATTEGAGSVKLKAGKKVVFSSEKNRKTQDIPNDLVPDHKDENSIARMVDNIYGEKK